MRKIRDEAGIEWTVYEVNPTAGQWRSIESLPEGYRRGWLCFESEGEKRRLAPVPVDWDQAGPDKLGTWLQAAKRVLKCGP